MPHLKEISQRIRLISSTQQITKAIKMVAASKLHKAQRALGPLKLYTGKCNSMLSIMLSHIDPYSDYKSAFIQPTLDLEPSTILLIVVTGNRGLCGAFNKHILRAAHQYLTQLQSHQTVKVLVIGKKAFQFFKKQKYETIDSYIDLTTSTHLGQYEKLAQYCMHEWQTGRYDAIISVYHAFEHIAQNKIKIRSLLPIIPQDYLKEEIEGQHTTGYIFEPSTTIVLNKLIQCTFTNAIACILAESIASEQSARVLTMGQAYENADELLKALHIYYNKSRQALITNALSEITGLWP